MRLGLSRVVWRVPEREIYPDALVSGEVRELEHAIHRAVVLAEPLRSGDRSDS
ncbi:hypothetical protein ACNKHX_16500 [Shigella flexneri]